MTKKPASLNFCLLGKLTLRKLAFLISIAYSFLSFVRLFFSHFRCKFRRAPSNPVSENLSFFDRQEQSKTQQRVQPKESKHMFSQYVSMPKSKSSKRGGAVVWVGFLIDTLQVRPFLLDKKAREMRLALLYFCLDASTDRPALVLN